jgi:hypothetical protein
MFFGEGLFTLVFVGLWIYCVFDVIRTDDAAVENLPKMFWLLIVIFVPTIGSIAWLLLGRPRNTSFKLPVPRARTEPQSPPPPAAPSPPPIDPEEFRRRREEALRRHEAEREERRRREEGLGERS